MRYAPAESRSSRVAYPARSFLRRGRRASSSKVSSSSASLREMSAPAIRSVVRRMRLGRPRCSSCWAPDAPTPASSSFSGSLPLAAFSSVGSSAGPARRSCSSEETISEVIPVLRPSQQQQQQHVVFHVVTYLQCTPTTLVHATETNQSKPKQNKGKHSAHEQISLHATLSTAVL